MTIKMAIDDELLNIAFKIGGYSSKSDTVYAALKEFILRRKTEDIIGLFGTFESEESSDRKKSR